MTVRSGNSLTISAMFANTVMPRFARHADAAVGNHRGIDAAALHGDQTRHVVARRHQLDRVRRHIPRLQGREHAELVGAAEVGDADFLPFEIRRTADFLARDKAVEILVQKRRRDRQIRA